MSIGTDIHRIDAHLHVWDLEQGEYAWLGPEHGPLFRSFTAEEAGAELDAAGVDSAVLVQAEDSARDTDFLLATADRRSWVAGVVGWVRLDDPGAARSQLEGRLQHPAFCGVRHLVHDDPRDDFLALPPVRASLDLLARHDVPFDVPDAWPRHLAATAELAADLPDLRVVVDHLAKPPRDREDYDDWKQALAAVAAHPNTVAKVSGLQAPGAPFTTDALRPVWETALDLFGPTRLMYGGDWPMTVPTGGYQATWAVLSGLVAELSADEQTQVLATTATSTYRLGSRRRTVTQR